MLNLNKQNLAGIRGGVVLLLLLAVFNPMFSFSEEIRYQSGDRRDPFIPVTRNVVASSSSGEIQVEGIIFDPRGQSMVVIHGDMYKVGDEIGGQKITAIHTNKIIVSANGTENEYWISNAEQQLAQNQENKKT